MAIAPVLVLKRQHRFLGSWNSHIYVAIFYLLKSNSLRLTKITDPTFWDLQIITVSVFFGPPLNTQFVKITTTATPLVKTRW